MSTGTARVPLLDPETNRFPDTYTPQGALDAVADARAARTAAETAATAATGARAGAETARTAAIAAQDAAEDARDGALAIVADGVTAAITESAATRAALDAKAAELALNPANALGAIVGGARRQAELLGSAMRKLRKGQDVKLVTRGDSTTYGHDTVSADRIAAPTETLPDGTKHSFTRSPRTWPQALGEHLDAVYAGVVTVENQGYSGDYVKRGFDRWTSNAGADITIIGYGINDASASYVPEPYRGSIPLYIEWLERMILRDLAWGSAVVLTTSTRQRGSSGSEDTESFRTALGALATKYGIPIIDMERFLENAKADAWSDGNHLTTKGNAIVGARLAAAFIGDGPGSPFVVGEGTKLLPRPTLSNMRLNGAIIGASTGYQTPDDGAGGIALQAPGATGTHSAVFSFYTDAPDVVIFPIDYIDTRADQTRAIDYVLDFGVEQGQTYQRRVIDPANGIVPDEPATLTRSGVVGSALYKSSPTADSGLRVATPGWHTLTVTFRTTGNAAGVACTHAIEFLSWRTWANARSITPRVSTLEARKGLNALGAYVLGVPTSYNPNVDIPETRLPWFTALADLGVATWSGDYYKAPMVRLTVRSYGVGWMEYDILCTAGNPALTDVVPAQDVGGVARPESGRTVAFVREAGAYSYRTDGKTPKDFSTGRELASVGLDAANNLVLTWRTTNSADGTTLKNLKQNSVLSLRVL